MADSDDDIPISELIAKNKAKKKETGSAKKSASAKKEASKAPKKKEAPVKKSTKQDEAPRKRQKEETRRESNVKPGEEESILGLERMDKHNIVSAILLRWTYCLDPWPGKIEEPLPRGFIEGHVDGLQVGIAGSVLGELRDVRKFQDGKVPSMKSLLSLKAVELRDILMKGIERQRKDLGESLGDQELRKKLDREYVVAENLKIKKIERKYQEALQELKDKA